MFLVTGSASLRVSLPAAAFCWLPVGWFALSPPRKQQRGFAVRAPMRLSIFGTHGQLQPDMPALWREPHQHIRVVQLSSWMMTGKSTIYTVAAGINPRQLLPISLDTGCDVESVREARFYSGLPRRRARLAPCLPLLLFAFCSWKHLLTAATVGSPSVETQKLHADPLPFGNRSKCSVSQE